MNPGEAKAELVEAAASRATDPALAEFIRGYYEHSGSEDVVGIDPLDLYGAALAHRRLGERRGERETIVRVYTPRADENGWQSTHTVVEVVMDDMPFIVDSVRMELNRHSLGIHTLHHPIIDGVSYVHVEVDRQGDPDVSAQIERDLIRVLGDVRAAVDDWQPMLAKLREVIADLERNPPPVDREELAEAIKLLEWLADNHLTLLGYRDYDLTQVHGEDAIVQVPGTGLGILRQREGDDSAATFTKLPPEIRELAREPIALTLTKANSVSTVHRPSYLDYLGIKRFDASGTVVGERRFLGLYTANVYTSSPTTIPLLRRKVQHVLTRADLPPGGHDEKDLLAILETFPRDELIQIGDDELHDTALGILHLQERRRVKLFLRRDRFGRFYSALVFLPRERYNTDTRVAIQRILLDALHGDRIEHDARISESVLARLHFVVHVDAAIEHSKLVADLDVATVEQRIAGAVRDWNDDLHDSLVEAHGEDHGIDLFVRYRDAFRAAYRAEHQARAAVGDIDRLEALTADDLGMHLYRPLESTDSIVRFKLYRSGGPVLISDVLPVLENMGVRVVDQRPHTVRPARDGVGEDTVSDVRWIYDFGLLCADGVDLERRSLPFQEAFARIWRGDVQNDGFNRLVVLAGLGWRDVAMLRAYAKYLRQTGTTFSPEYVESAMAQHPDVAGLLVELFHTRFAPMDVVDREGRAASLVERIERALDAVASLDEDRILRSFLTMIMATLRTSFFQRDSATGGDERPGPGRSEHKGHLALKLDPHKIPDLPRPLPMYEVWVYSPRVEGVHLRGGPVARGGIRWSDRREDFRTEVLGLMKAQMVKNAVIVPVGAKGGFVVKEPPSDRESLAAEVEACYRTFIGGLLDITDNLRGTEVVPPVDVIRYDGDDPYLVVAADKGTATFSDIANELAVAHGFWLGDAFASGGSAGYDHKKMGITARGAWESVKRHFRELGVDVQSDDVTVAGIGDMSGDVFGNGMLLSRHLKLIAAFNHMHIFLDPDPDPAASFEERARLFALPRSTWADYDTALLSAGGGVHERSAKSITLTPEVRAALGVDETALAPNDLIRAILRAPVDLVWNGGIGTYVKASIETHADVGDKTNDGVRVDASELRCRVVGEGGNLGFTQRGRVEAARGGVRINTDAIDNSAGVDCSDHEVNIKILLDAVVADGELTTKQRNALLVEMTDEVAQLVLADNERQTRALSNSVAQAASLADVHARYIRVLEAEGELDRSLEFLPTEEELLDRRSEGKGLTAPEFAVLLAYTKNILEKELLATDLPDDPYLVGELERYFPHQLRERFGGEIRNHKLRREIVATAIASGMVDHQGITYAYRLADETGASPERTARAFIVARDVFDTEGLWREVAELDGQLDAATQTAVLLEGRKLVERATRWLLRHRPAAIDIGADVENLADGVRELAAHLPELLVGIAKRRHRQMASSLRSDSVPDALATRVAAFDELFGALDIVEVARELNEPVEVVATIQLQLEDQLELCWLREQVNALPRDSRWQTLARIALREDLYAQLRQLTVAVLGETPSSDPPAKRIEHWLATRAATLARVRQVLGDVRAGGVIDLATLSVALRETQALAGS